MDSRKVQADLRKMMGDADVSPKMMGRCLTVLDQLWDLDDGLGVREGVTPSLHALIAYMDPAKLKHAAGAGKKVKAELGRLRAHLQGVVWEMPAPTYEDDAVRIFEGDCYDLMQRLKVAGEVFNLVLTDPPFNISKPKGDYRYKGDASAKVRDFGGWDFGFDPQALMDGAHPLLADGGSLVAFTSDLLIGAYKMQDPKKWNSRGTMIWEKNNPPTSPRPGYVSACEFIVWLARTKAPAIWNADGYTRNVFRYPTASGRKRMGHPTEKPVQLLKDLIMRHSDPGDLILDPFMGSGSTLRAAKDLGRKAIGLEMDPEYVAMAAARCKQEAFGFDGRPIQLGLVEGGRE